MASRNSESQSPQAASVAVAGDGLTVALTDGRSVTVPLDWYPRLFESSHKERQNWRLIDEGRGIHWESIDEDTNVAGLVAGRRSGESAKSLARWRAAREKAKV